LAQYHLFLVWGSNWKDLTGIKLGLGCVLRCKCLPLLAVPCRQSLRLSRIPATGDIPRSPRVPKTA
jgi:hypothetical protein